MVLLLAALLTTSTPSVLEARSATLLPLAQVDAPKSKPEFSFGLTASAPIIGLFAEIVGGTIAVQTLAGPLTAALTIPRETLRILVLPGGLLAAALIAAASAVAIEGWLKRPDIELPLRTMWICGGASLAIATAAGIIVGFLTGDPVIGMIYGLGVGAVGAPIIQTVVAVRGAKFRQPPGAQLSFAF